MASTITISLNDGGLVSQNSYANDAKVQKTLLAYFDKRGLAGTDNPSELSNQEKLDRVLDDLVDQILDTVRIREIRDRIRTSQQIIESDVDTEYDFTI